MLNVKKNIENGKAAFELEGRLDTTSAPVFEKELKDTLDGVTEMSIDLEKLEYISSAGLRVLLIAHKTMARKGGLRVLHPDKAVMEVFEVTGFSELLNIE